MPTAEQVNRKSVSGIKLRLDRKPTIVQDGRFTDGQYFTVARAVEGPNPNSYSLGGRVFVNGEDTYIEMPPQDDWFEIRTMRGVKKVYLKSRGDLHVDRLIVALKLGNFIFQVTGLEPIYYGPYDTKEEALLAHHRILDHAQDAFLNG
jgi:hypothetical protein